jgi:hypothetical protein
MKKVAKGLRRGKGTEAQRDEKSEKNGGTEGFSLKKLCAFVPRKLCASKKAFVPYSK